MPERKFNPNEHLRQIKSSQGNQDYLDVKWRLVWFREQCPNGTIDTEELAYDLDREMSVEAFVWNNEKRRSEKVIKTAPGYARYRATVTDGKGGRATGTKSECAASFADFGEKAETGAIGRALAALGFGTQFAADLDEGDRIVDAPVDRKPIVQVQAQQPTGEVNILDMPVTDQQSQSIRKLCEHLHKQVTAPATYGEAKELIAQLSQEYRTSRKTA